MSYTVYPYLVDLERLRQVYGSRRWNLLAEIERRFARDISEHDDDDFEMTPAVREAVGDAFAVEVETPTVRDALREIVAGRVQPTEDTEPYGFALELLCEYLGAPLPNDRFETVTARGLRIVGAIDGLAQGPHHVSPPIPLARWPSPTLTCLTNDAAAAILARYTAIEPAGTDEAHNHAWVADVQEQYLSWLRASIHARDAIVAFLY